MEKKIVGKTWVGSVFPSSFSSAFFPHIFATDDERLIKIKFTGAKENATAVNSLTVNST
jgi:hypothetical protein